VGTQSRLKIYVELPYMERFYTSKSTLLLVCAINIRLCRRESNICWS